MAVSRRKFIKAGTLVLLSAGVPLKAVAEQLPGRSNSKTTGGSHADGLHFLTRATFSAQLNTTFRVAAGASDAVSLKLIEVNDLRSAAVQRSAAMRGKECFSVVFSGPQSRPLKQNTYVLDHDALGKLLVLVVPVGEGRQGFYYEAVFNRLY